MEEVAVVVVVTGETGGAIGEEAFSVRTSTEVVEVDEEEGEMETEDCEVDDGVDEDELVEADKLEEEEEMRKKMWKKTRISNSSRLLSTTFQIKFPPRRC